MRTTPTNQRRWLPWDSSTRGWPARHRIVPLYSIQFGHHLHNVERDTCSTEPWTTSFQLVAPGWKLSALEPRRLDLAMQNNVSRPRGRQHRTWNTIYISRSGNPKASLHKASLVVAHVNCIHERHDEVIEATNARSWHVAMQAQCKARCGFEAGLRSTCRVCHPCEIRTKSISPVQRLNGTIITAVAI